MVRKSFVAKIKNTYFFPPTKIKYKAIKLQITHNTTRHRVAVGAHIHLPIYFFLYIDLKKIRIVLWGFQSKYLQINIYFNMGLGYMNRMNVQSLIKFKKEKNV